MRLLDGDTYRVESNLKIALPTPKFLVATAFEQVFDTEVNDTSENKLLEHSHFPTISIYPLFDMNLRVWVILIPVLYQHRQFDLFVPLFGC
jgi:hypothetical protein